MNSVTSRIVSLLLIICVATCLMTIGFHMLSDEYETETAIFATADDSATFKGVYIRDEQLVQYGGIGTVSYCIPDGGKLGSGSAIAEIYSDEAQIDIKQQISDLEGELAILKKIQNPGTVESAQPANIAALIDEQYRAIVDSRELRNLDVMSLQKNELLVLISTYQLVTDSDVDFTSRINEINSEISRLKSSEKVPLDTILSDRSAYFVSYADGYESQLTKSSLETLTPEIIADVEDSGPVEDERIIGKLINGYEWYIAGVIDNRKKNFTIGDKVNIKFQSTSNMAEGVIENIRDSDDPSENVIIVRCDEITHDLVQHRTERVEIISGEFEGIKVPRKALRFKNVTETVTDEETGEETTQTVNAKGVYVKLGERISFKRIDVIYEGGDYVLSSLDAGEEYLALYDDIVVEGVDADGN